MVVADDEVCLEAMELRVLHLHSRAYLFFGGCVAKHSSVETDVFRGINKEDFVNHFVEAAFKKDCTFKGNSRLPLLFLCPSLEVLEDNRMDDGVYLACVFDIGKEEIGKSLPVETLSVEHFGTDKGDEFLANLLICGGESLGFSVAVIDRNVELLPEQLGNIAFAATDAACNAYCFHLLLLRVLR